MQEYFIDKAGDYRRTHVSQRLWSPKCWQKGAYEGKNHIWVDVAGTGTVEGEEEEE